MWDERTRLETQSRHSRRTSGLISACNRVANQSLVSQPPSFPFSKNMRREIGSSSLALILVWEAVSLRMD